MSDKSKIEWTEASWNPITGCTEVSPGCDRCYAKTFAERWRGTPGHHFERGFDVVLRPERLDQPMRWKKPRRIFVNSMSDLFHDAIPDDYIASVFIVMAQAPQHTFQLLTKRHGRMRSLLSRPEFVSWVRGADRSVPWPLPNVWLGVSVENQPWADIRIPALIDTPAAVRWVSAEPLLGPIDLNRVDKDALVDGGLDWLVCGGESGPGARPMHPDWARQLRDRCVSAGVPFFFKQWGAWRPTGQYDWKADNRCQVVEPDGTLAGKPYADVGSMVGRTAMTRYPKHEAGRELDGRTWDEYPRALVGGAA